MKAVIADGPDKGKVVEFSPGISVMGRRFSEVTVTLDDLRDELSIQWFMECVICRLVPNREEK